MGNLFFHPIVDPSQTKSENVFPVQIQSEDVVARQLEDASPSQIFVKIHNKDVPVNFESNMTLDDAEKCIKCVPFVDWMTAINKDTRFNVQGITLQGADFFGKRIGFVKFKTEIVNQDGKFIPGIVFMRGGAVGILVILLCEGEEFTIITLQPRIPIGHFNFPEIPAGMLDSSGDFAGVAAKELQEECEIFISEKKNCFVDLTEFAYEDRFRGMYPSAGGCDEFMRLFVYREEVTREKLNSLKGKLTGLATEGEMITLKIVPLGDLWREAPDAKALSALSLYEKFRKIYPSWPDDYIKEKKSVV